MTTAEIKNGKLVITMDINNPPTLSSTGKSYLIASSNGWMATGAMLGDQPVKVNVTANIKQLPTPTTKPTAEPAGRFTT